MTTIKVSAGVTQKNMKIADGRNFFWQWDTGCQLTIIGIPSVDEVHFFRLGMAEPFSLKARKDGNNIVCNVPDELLQAAAEFTAYAYIEETDGCRTMLERKFEVKQRPKPSDYIYTETERYTVEKAVETALQEAKESGEFDGKDGINGKDGYTPVKGEDYYTEAERAEMIAEIEESVIGDIDTTLDSIIAIQESLIGGKSV